MLKLRTIAQVFCVVLAGWAGLQGATTAVSPGTGLQAAIDAAAAGDTLQLQAGTYTSSFSNLSYAWHVTKAITIAGVAGTILSAPNYYIVMQIDGIASGTATIQGLTMNGGSFGVLILSTVTSGSASTPGVLLKSLNINPNSTGSAGHGVASAANYVTADTVAVTGGTANAFDIGNATGSVIKNCTIGNSPRGIYINAAPSTTVQNCGSIATASFEGILVSGASSGALIDSVTIASSGSNAIYVQGGSNNVTVQNSTVTQAAQNGILIENSSSATIFHNTVTLASSQNGIWLTGSGNSVVDSNTVVRASLNGIILDNGSNGNVAMNNVIQRTDTQHGIAIRNSDSNIVTSNTVTNAGAVSAANGLEAIGGRFNRIEKNTVTAFSNDGIVLTPYPDNATPSTSGYRPSILNYVGKNTITGSSTTRTGIWLNDASNGTYVFGNTQSTAAEGGITDFNASAAVIRGNTVTNNQQAGIFVWNVDTAFPKPADIVIQNNYSHDNPSNGEVLIRGGDRAEISYNYFSMAGSAGLSTGIGIAKDPVANTGGSTGDMVFLNTVRNTQFPNNVTADTQQAAFFQNRYFNPAGSTSYVYQGATASWDVQFYLGGNFWSDFSSPNNPPHYTASPTSNSNFVTDSNGGRSGSYADRFPFGSEDLGKDHSVTVQWPVAGEIAAPGSLKTIAWKSNGCVLVDIYYTTGSGRQNIQTNYPDVGIYNWTVPSVSATTATAGIDCKNSAGTAYSGGTGTSGSFTISAAGLLLLSPGPEQPITGASSFRAAWAKTGSVNSVNVFIRTGSGAWTQVGSNVTANYFDVPPQGINSNRVSILIQASNNAAIQDSVDAYFTLRNGTATFTYPTAGTNLVLGSVVDVEWISPPGSYYVDLQLFDPTLGKTQNIYGNVRDYVLNLPDYGRYTWFVPERWMSSCYFKLTFKDANGVTITTLNGPTFNVRYPGEAGVTGALTYFYRLYSTVTLEHLYTTDLNEYNVLGTRGWIQEGPIGQILNGPRNVSGVDAVPYYRLYNNSSQQHHWTTDRNEYFTLRDYYPLYNPEHLIGYVFFPSTPVSGTTPLYRLVYNLPPFYHLWTTDTNEYSVLATRGWTQEGVAALIYCVPGDTSHPGCASSISSTGAPIFSTSAAGQGGAFGAGWGTVASPASAGQSPSASKGKAPVLKAVVNGASYASGPVAPGETVSVFGEWMGPAAAVAREFVSGMPIGGELAEVRVLFNDIAAPLLYASDRELKAIVPFELADKRDIEVRVEYQGRVSNALLLKVADAAPGIFTADMSGKGQAAVLNEDRTANGAENPAPRGSLVTLFATGEGILDPALATGQLPPVSDAKTPRPLLPVSVDIGGVPAEVVSAASSAGLPGLMQVQVRVPADAAAGAAVPIVVRIGFAASEPVATMAVR